STLYSKIVLEELDDRKERARLSIRNRHALDNEAALDTVRPTKLVVQPGFSDAGLADHADDLAAAGLRMVERLRQLLHLDCPSHELRQPAHRRRREPRSR